MENHDGIMDKNSGILQQQAQLHEYDGIQWDTHGIMVGQWVNIFLQELPPRTVCPSVGPKKHMGKSSSIVHGWCIETWRFIGPVHLILTQLSDSRVPKIQVKTSRNESFQRNTNAIHSLFGTPKRTNPVGRQRDLGCLLSRWHEMIGCIP